MCVICYFLPDQLAVSMANRWVVLNPSKHKHLYNICTTPAQLLRRWSDIVQMLYKCFAFAGMCCVLAISYYSLFSCDSLAA